MNKCQLFKQQTQNVCISVALLFYVFSCRLLLGLSASNYTTANTLRTGSWTLRLSNQRACTYIVFDDVSVEISVRNIFASSRKKRLQVPCASAVPRPVSLLVPGAGNCRLWIACAKPFQSRTSTEENS